MLNGTALPVSHHSRSPRLSSPSSAAEWALSEHPCEECMLRCEIWQKPGRVVELGSSCTPTLQTLLLLSLESRRMLVSKQEALGTTLPGGVGCSAVGWSCWCQLAIMMRSSQAHCKTAAKTHMEISRVATKPLASVTPIICGRKQHLVSGNMERRRETPGGLLERPKSLSLAGSLGH